MDSSTEPSPTGSASLEVAVAAMPEQIAVPPRLNYDIILAIMRFAERREVGRMTSTCRILWHAGVPHLLQGQIEIYSMDQLVSLCRYMDRDASRRSRYFRELSLAMFVHSLGPSPTLAPFTRLLSTYGQHLQKLEIACTSHVASTLSRLFPILTGLHSLILRASSGDAKDLLTKIQAPITRLLLSFHDDWSRNGAITADPAVICAPLKDSLEFLMVGDVTLQTSHIQYTRLTRLTVGGCNWAELTHIYRQFPNLTHLRLWMIQEDENVPTSRADEHRMLNIRGRGYGCWKNLQLLESGLLSLYILAVRSTVDHLDLVRHARPIDIEASDVDGPRLLAVLADTRPSKLQLAFRTSILEGRTPNLGELLDLAKDRLKDLTIIVQAHSPQYVDPSSALNTMLSTLSAFKLEYLGITIRWAQTPSQEDTSNSAGPFPWRSPPLPDDLIRAIMDPQSVRAEPPGPSLGDIDSDAVALQIMNALPSLRYFSLWVQPKTGPGRRFESWEFMDGAHGGGSDGRTVVKLNPDVGWQILTERGLINRDLT